ncbi:hypothetical protein VCO01S_04590 [Vibrio comitans NBRC 102076]|uniref:Uncharacterized protein n=1 Tax=Vibrio comitans NBRC 102076 TaxID=1219078 RepID=A0A4Y3IIR6_9VIBR|nr:hypothetical protein VCO01S_04590 [Vibrio comitans NBRC 102076]
MVGAAEAKAKEVIMAKRENEKLEGCSADTVDVIDESLFVDIISKIYN